MSDGWLVDLPEVRWLLGHGDEGGRGPGGVPPGVWVQVGSGRLYQMPELGQQRFELGGALGAGRLPLQLGVSWENLGQALYREGLQEGWLSLGREWTLTLRVVRRSRQLGGVSPGTDRTFVWELGGQLWRRPALVLRVDVRLKRWRPGPFYAEIPRQGFLKVTLTRDRVALAVALDRDPYGTPGLGLDALLAVGRNVGLSLRVDPATGSIGPGITVLWGRLYLRTSHVVHPFLGPSHRVVMGLGTPGLRRW